MYHSYHSVSWNNFYPHKLKRLNSKYNKVQENIYIYIIYERWDLKTRPDDFGHTYDYDRNQLILN